MPISQLDSLTPGEQAVLSALLEQRDQKAVARALGLSPETVKTHLRNAREKCGADTSFALAKAFALHRGAPPRWGITFNGGEDSRPAPAMEPASMPTETGRWPRDELRDVRTSFAFDQPSGSRSATHLAGGDAGRRTINRLFTIAAVALLLVILIILAFPLSESFQRMANVIDPPSS